MKWSEDDRRLMSCGSDGSVYEWNALTGAIESENVQNYHTYIAAMFLPNTGSILTVDSNMTFNEFRDGKARKKLHMNI